MNDNRNKFPIKQFELHVKKKYEIIIGAGILFFMAIFYHNWLNIELMKNIGCFLVIISLILVLKSNILRKKGELAETKGYVTTKLVNSGIYGIVRHPIYLSLFYLFMGLMFISQHPVSIVIGLILMFYCYYLMIAEEKKTVAKFGDDYIQYMKRVPRANLVKGLWLLITQKNNEENQDT